MKTPEQSFRLWKFRTMTVAENDKGVTGLATVRFHHHESRRLAYSKTFKEADKVYSRKSACGPVL